MSNELTLERVFECAFPLTDVIFVHGLTGDPLTTWSNSSYESFWPQWISEEFASVAVYTLGYPASVLAKWARTEMDLFERANNILERFAGVGIGQRPIVFVSHSLGGILVKLILRKSCDAKDPDWNQVSVATRLVVFLSTPHTGADIARVLKILPHVSSHVDLLANKSGFLEDLNGHYRTFALARTDLATAVYYEKYPTNGVLVVPKESADPGLAGVVPVPIDRDHVSICKPQSRDDTVYLGVKRHIHRVVKSMEEAASRDNSLRLVDNYSEKNTRDRRDLFHKLIDAGREHEYRYANDAQNGFARQYTKTGLLAAAREDHENLLSEIETRFVTHVYHPLICHSAADRDVRAALQEKVIDKLAGKEIGGTRVSPKLVLNGLYYLTEQCHISWDKPS